MESTVPLPLRVAAGLLATGIDQLRRLPEELPGLSVTAVGKAVQLSMRVQQGINQLADRGEELLGGMFSQPSENPEWARFDEDEAGEEAGGGAGSSSGDDGAPAESERGADPRTGSASGGPALDGYETMSLAQLRARMTSLPVETLAALLAYEENHQGRAPFVTMLTNRIARVRAGGHVDSSHHGTST